MSFIPQHGFKVDDLIKRGRTTKSKIEEMRKWLSLKRIIPPMSDEQIALLLIACSNNIEHTQITTENYFKIKSSAPELFTNRDIDCKEMQQTHSCS